MMWEFVRPAMPGILDVLLHVAEWFPAYALAALLAYLLWFCRQALRD